jgi:kynureninase
MPKSAIKAVQASIEANKFPHQITDAVFFEIPNRLRSNIARLIGAQPEEIALTTGGATQWLTLTRGACRAKAA